MCDARGRSIAFAAFVIAIYVSSPKFLANSKQIVEQSVHIMHDDAYLYIYDNIDCVPSSHIPVDGLITL